MARDVPAGIVRSKSSSTGCALPGYAKRTLRNRISRAGMVLGLSVPDDSAPVGAILGSRRNTAATGADAPSSAQLNPPNAISDTPTTHCAYTTSAPVVMRPLDAADASAQHTATLATST